MKMQSAHMPMQRKWREMDKDKAKVFLRFYPNPRASRKVTDLSLEMSLQGFGGLEPSLTTTKDWLVED